MKVSRKVSRKVARRKHSHSSSVSRRRLRNNKNNKNKSGYKKRYAKTQKGGKRGRGQKRVRVHTHKRGRRFHRGGVGKWNDDSWENDVASGLLVYKKIRTGSITSQTKSFRVTLEKTSDLIKIASENGYQGENFIRFKVTMKRYRDGVNTDGVNTDGVNTDFNKIFTIYFAFGYVPLHVGGGGQYATEWFLFQTTENNDLIKQTLLYWDPDRSGFYPHKESRMPAKVNTNTRKVSIKLPEEFNGIIGLDLDIPDKSKPYKYIFWGEKMGFTNWPDASRSNVDFFNSLATQMYRIVRTTENNALARPAPATTPSLASAESATPPPPGSDAAPAPPGSDAAPAPTYAGAAAADDENADS